MKLIQTKNNYTKSYLKNESFKIQTLRIDLHKGSMILRKNLHFYKISKYVKTHRTKQIYQI